MKKRILLVIIIISSLSFSCANDNSSDFKEKIFEGDVTLTTQSEVNKFGSNNYTEITGALIVSANTNDVSLSNLEALKSLKTVGKYIKIESNDKLINLNGLNSVSTVSGILIRLNNSLINIDALSNISTINQEVEIFNNSKLTNVDGLRNAVGAKLSNVKIHGNQNLTSIRGLSKILQTENLYIANNPLLINLNGLENLNSIGEVGYTSSLPTLIVQNNASLVDVNSLNKLTYVKGALYIKNNNALANLNGLDNIQLIGGGNLIVSDNKVLNSLCALKTVLSNPKFIGQFSAVGNLYNPTKLNIQNGNCAL
ncbi:hypothetical protein RB619_12190 [Flavobacterium sp. LHD-80]|uniref:hypothetical protein n=1 Tax=Flavobacterium sp. LHD-80 TaxID=3071411 RepID=UPI0027DFFE98|nr:hypothetical protein [Flavobacterium sp. LHD-80]MDQ6471407.1 hypothetical protein [Flavobacterium sp. LHD-80]